MKTRVSQVRLVRTIGRGSDCVGVYLLCDSWAWSDSSCGGVPFGYESPLTRLRGFGWILDFLGAAIPFPEVVRADRRLETRCSEGLASWRPVGRAHNGVPVCIYGTSNARRTVRNTPTGGSSRAVGWPTAAWSSGTCCTSVRSTTPRNGRGPARSRSFPTRRPRRRRWPYSRRNVSTPPRTREFPSCGCGSRSCRCPGRGNGTPAGWPYTCGASCGWTNSGAPI